MAITTVTSPEQVSLARSPILVKINSNLPTEQTPFNYIRIRVDDTMVVNETIRFVYGDIDETFTVLNASDDTGNTLSVRAALTIAEYAAKIVEDLKKNYPLYINFEIETELQGSTHYVYLRQRVDKNLVWTYTNNLSGVVIDNINSPNAVYQQNQSILLLVETYNHESQSYDQRLSHVLPILKFGESVDFNIQNDFDLKPALPNKNSIGIGGEFFELAKNNWTKYKLYYTEQVGRPANTGALQSDGLEYYALFGGNDFFNQYKMFWAFWKDNGKFLTSAPRTQTVSFEQPIWLYWVGRVNRIIKIGVKVYFRSGAPMTLERGEYVESIGEVIMLKAGFTQLQLPESSVNPITHYEVYLTSSKTILSEIFTFNLTGSCDNFTRYFVFTNGLGGLDCLRTTAKHASELDTTSQIGKRIINQDSISEGLGENFDYNRRSVISYEGSTGFKSASYISYLQDFINSPAVWLVDLINQRFTPVIINTGNTPFVKDDEDLYALRFSYSFAWEEQFLGVTDDGNRITILSTDAEEADVDPCIDC